MSLEPQELRAGDKLVITFQDGKRTPVKATIREFASDRDEGMSPEVEDYVACWIEVNNDGSDTDQKVRSVTLGTDSQYYLDGSKVDLIKS